MTKTAPCYKDNIILYYIIFAPLSFRSKLIKNKTRKKNRNRKVKTKKKSKKLTKNITKKLKS
nr:MAG TPA: hypothetical protein [Caudoviricetes sp.]